MKKLVITFFAFYLSIIILNSAIVTYKFYDLPMYPEEIYVRNDKNLASPDLIGKPEISTGVYRLYSSNGINIDYNIINGQYKINGTWTAATGVSAVIYYSNELVGYTTSVNVQIISGLLPSGIYYRPSGLVDYQIETFQGQSLSIEYIRNSDHIRMVNGEIFNDFTYTVQLEKGSTATYWQNPYKKVIDYPDINYYNELGKYGINSIKTIFNSLVFIGQNPVVLFFTDTMPFMSSRILAMLSPIVEWLNVINDTMNDFFYSIPRKIDEIIDGLKFWE